MRAIKTSILKQWTNTVVLGDCLDSLKELPDNCVDSIVTDPDYGYNFMNLENEWGGLPSIDIWKECLRVLKPGAWCLVMSAPRQDVLSRMIVRLEDAGFDIGFSSIYWCYSSGFPKAASISKSVDRRLGGNPNKILQGKPIKRMIPGGTQNKTGSWIKDDGREYQPCIEEPATPEAKALDGSFAGMQLKPATEIVIVCMKPLSEGSYVDQALKSLYDGRCVVCSYDEVKVGGYNTRLDCGCFVCDECLLSCEYEDHKCKPNQYGRGVTWMDNCRIPYQSEDDKEEGQSSRPSLADKGTNQCDMGSLDRSDRSNIKGRFPANLLVQDDILNDGQISKSGNIEPHIQGVDSIFRKKGTQVTGTHVGDSGLFSRYFDLDAWGRENGFPDDELSPLDTFPFMIVSKPSVSEKNAGLGDFEDKPSASSEFRPNHKEKAESGKSGNPYGRWKKLKNNHPTVKPLRLAAWLLTLTTRPGDLIVDIFAGSGTTLIAAMKTKRKFIGMELKSEYVEIIEARLAYTKQMIAKEKVETGVSTRDDRTKAKAPLTFEDLA